MQSFHFDRELMLKLLRFGSPAGIEMFLNLLAFTIVIMLFHADGLVTATAVTIVFNWDMVSFVPLLGIQIGVVSLVGRYMGAGRPDLAARATNSGLTMALAYSSLILILFVFLPEFLVAVFQPQITDDIYLQANPLAVQMLRLAALYVLADAMMVVFSGALRGAGDTFWTMCISVTLHWMLIPVLLLVLRVFNLPPQIAWLALIAAFMVFSGMFYLRYRSGRWKALNLVDNKISLPLLPGG
jgi:MATE family multidrug resistance protein